jgi:hypothetical protein
MLSSLLLTATTVSLAQAQFQGVNQAIMMFAPNATIYWNLRSALARKTAKMAGVGASKDIE